MCVIVFFVRDRTSADPFVDAKAYKRGDLIQVLPDGHQFSAAELSNPEWRILRLPNITVEEATYLCRMEVDTSPPDDDPSKTDEQKFRESLIRNRMLQRRGNKFDIDASALPAAVKTWLLDDKRAVPIASRNFTLAQFKAFVQQRPKRPDPDVL